MSFHDIQQINNNAQNESAARYPALQEAIENYIVNIIDSGNESLNKRQHECQAGQGYASQ